MFEINQQDMSRNREEKTIVVFGCPRGGTTMIANILLRFGIRLNSGLDPLPANLEDPNFNWDVLCRNMETSGNKINKQELVLRIKDHISCTNKTSSLSSFSELECCHV